MGVCPRSESATALTLFCNASCLWGRYWISTSRPSNRNCVTSCKVGRRGASAGCAADVRG